MGPGMGASLILGGCMSVPLSGLAGFHNELASERNDLGGESNLSPVVKRSRYDGSGFR